MRRLLILPLIIALLAACGGANPDAEVADLPTVAVLPSATDSPVPPPPSATLPETWTPTPTETATPEPSQTLTLTITPSQTITDTPSPTFTFEPTVTLINSPLTGILNLAQQATVLPDDYEVPPFEGVDVPLEVIQATSSGEAVDEPTPEGFINSEDCQYTPTSGFGAVYLSNAGIADKIGCPVGDPPEARTMLGAWQSFENGMMLWLNDGSDVIHVLRGRGSVWQQYVDTFVENVDPETYEPAPQGFFSPIRGFGKVWANNQPVRDDLGWGTSIETGDPEALVQDFSNGRMIYFPTFGDVIVLIAATDSNSSWQIVVADF